MVASYVGWLPFLAALTPVSVILIFWLFFYAAARHFSAPFGVGTGIVSLNAIQHNNEQ
jgi:hypothetical protein